MEERNLTKEELSAMEIVYQFIAQVNNIYALYFDTLHGLQQIRADLIRRQIDEANKHPLEDREKILEEFDKAWWGYVHGPPTSDENWDLHSTMKEFKKRNADGGLNQRLLSNLCLATIYQLWEDYYRDRIAEAFGVRGAQRKNSVSSNMMGDIRRLRHSIIHHNGVAKKEILKNQILEWFKEGDDIFIDQNKMREIVNYIRDEFEIQVTRERTDTYRFHRSPSSLKPPDKPR
ncbi:MAG: hypothetical protein HY033_03145 [Ignavibacteriae bacterium]|nr:hypothetical protein [Ignavibacteria bacterium]MBI3363884.1 hypothetical protein [Ignavibacteriota bacterium]